MKLNECKNKDYLHDEIGKIWMVFAIPCQEEWDTHKCANEWLLEKPIYKLENQLEILQFENNSFSDMNEMLQRELNKVAFLHGSFCQ